MFVDRVDDLKALSAALLEQSFGLIVLYGRRRIGKTRLVLEAVKNRSHLYYLAVEKDNLRHFASLVAGRFPGAARLRADWEILLDFLKDRVEAVVIDEFQNMVKEDSSCLSLFQRAVDTSLKASRLKLFLLGSSVSVLSSEVLDYKSPLYGRKTMSKCINAMSFFDIAGFFPNAGVEELVEIYGFADGVPYYLEKVGLPFWGWLDAELRVASFIRDEVDFVLKYEFSEVGTYKTIIEAIANGKTTVGEIKDFARLQRTDISPYLSKLVNTGFVERRVPVTERVISKKGRYYLSDQFLAFWFRFIYSNLSAVEEKVYRAASIRRDYNDYLGHVFEKICRQFVAEQARRGFFSFERIGKWWDKDIEIDIAALDKNKNSLLLGECKWSDNVDARQLARELGEKAGFVLWHSGKRRESFVLFAKSFSVKITEFGGRTVHCFDLGGMAKAMRK